MHHPFVKKNPADISKSSTYKKHIFSKSLFHFESTYRLRQTLPVIGCVFPQI